MACPQITAASRIARINSPARPPDLPAAWLWWMLFPIRTTLPCAKIMPAPVYSPLLL